ncbi:MAG: hypothetical protein CSB34_07470 [Desulfobulbus propionicus]|nr:MAG: hypothetical protein CSB34_07470 [Desulfobulbus propionicus]
MKKLLLFFLLCFSLAALAFSYRVQVIEKIILFALTRAKIDQVVCDVAALDTNSISFKTFSASKNIEGKTYGVTLHDVSLLFTLAGLKQKQLENIHIHKAVLFLPETAAAQPKKQLTLPAEQQFAEQLEVLDRLSLPVEHLAVDTLLLQGSPVDVINTTPISLTLNSAPGTLEGQAILRLGKGKSVQAKVQRAANTKYHGTLELLSEQTPKTRIACELSRQGIKGSGAIDLKQLTHHFPQLGVPSDYAGVISYDFAAQLTEALTVNINSTFNNLVTDKGAIQNGVLDIAFQLNDLFHITIAERSSLTLNTVRTTASIGSACLGLGGSVHIGPQKVLVQPATKAPWVIHAIALGTHHISRLEFFPPTLLKTKNGLELTPDSAHPIRLHKVDVAGLHIPSLNLTPTTAIPVVVQSGDHGVTTISAPSWHTDHLTLEKKEQQITAEGLEFTTKQLVLQPEEVIADFAVGSDLLTFTQSPYRLPLADVQGNITLKKEHVQAQVTTELPLLEGRLQLHASHNLKQGKGEARLTSTKPIVFTSANSMDSLVQGLELPIKLSGGHLELSSHVAWGHQKLPQVKLQAHLSQAEGTGANLFFSGAELSEHLQLFPELRSLSPATLSVEQIQGAVPIKNLTGNCILLPSSRGKKPQVTLNQCSFDLLEGTVNAQPFTFDPNVPDHLLTVEANHIDLAAVTSLFKVKGLQVDGTISGTIPIHIAGKTISVDGGILTGGKQGGTISYILEEDSANHSQLTAYTLKALEEFHFTVLRAPVTYQPDGTLLVDLHLQGISPPLSTTRPVHLNVHTEQNLLSLLKSLRYNNVFTEELNSRLQNTRQSP